MFKKIILVAAAGLLLTGCLNQKPTTQEPKVEEFTGNLKDAMAKNLPMKCEWKADKNSGLFYVKGQKIYAETTTEEKKGYMISKEDCFWTWGDQLPQGGKFCAEPNAEEAESSIQERTETNSFNVEGMDWKTEYKCNPAIFGDEKFELPSGVEFQDVGEMMKNLQQAMPSMPAIPETPEFIEE